MDAAHAEQPPLIPAGPHAEVALEAAGLTDIGLHRETNEDSFLIGTLQPTLVVHEATASARGWFAGDPLGTLLIVADGMGGQGGGDVASRTAINAVSNYLLNALPWGPPKTDAREDRDSATGLRGQLSSALVAGDATIKTTGAKTRTPRMGTTLTAALVLWPVVYVAHVGDTRCYLLRNGRLRRLTTDHNMAEKFAAAGVEAVQLQSVLWNTLGASDQLPQPELCKLELSLGDVLLLCSDGLNNHVADEQIQAVLETEASSRDCCGKLVELALAGGGTDNVTALVARIAAAGANDTSA